MKIRKLLKKDIERYAQMCCYCFHMKQDDAIKYIETGVEFGRGSIVEENQQIMSAMFYYPFVQNIRFQKMKMAGLSGVVTMPEARNKGFVREQLKLIQKDIREQGFAISCLEPFKYSFYQKYGWTNAEEKLHCKIPINDIRKFDDKFEFVAVEKPTPNAFQQLERKFADQYNGCTYRENFFWERDILYNWDKSKPKFYYIIKKNGIEVSYIIFILKEIPKCFAVDLNICDFGYINYSGIEGIFAFAKKHRDNAKNLIISLPENFDIYHFVPTHFKDIKLISEMMFKVINIEKALVQLEIKPDLKFDFMLEIDDPISEENSGKFAFNVAEGNVERIHDSKNIFKTDISTFSRLFIGRNSVKEIIDYGEAKISENIIEPLDTMLLKENVYIKDWF
ncbi:MAG: GNAT family N-acetyltransferase [Candidatus Cloacimonetes bacterium]|nr:GNAT family N-acetyltransferase [Candidatus Cloacimonadota bacterium]